MDVDAASPAIMAAAPMTTDDDDNGVLAMFQLDETPANVEEEEDDEMDDDDLNRRRTRLGRLLPTLQELCWSKSPHAPIAAEKLADGSRDPKWRRPIGDAGILDFFLELVGETDLQSDVKLHTLRLIGNACADTGRILLSFELTPDQNRERVVAKNYMPTLIQQLQDTGHIPYVIPVLFNICVDYAPAQEQASQCLMTTHLIELANSPRFFPHRAYIGYVCKLLDLLVTQTREPELAPENTASTLLALAAAREALDLEDFLGAIGTAVAYLEHPRFQRGLVQQSSLDMVLMLMMDSYTRFDESTAGISYPAAGQNETENEEAKLLSQMRDSLNQVLSDVSALPEFAAAYPVVCPTTSLLRRWILSPQKQLQVCACIMLGNLARSDRTCEEFVLKSQVHKPLIAAVSDTTDSQLLHAALGFLKNLALPAANKTPLGDAGLIAALPRLWSLDFLPQIQYASVSLARVLVTGSWPNVERIGSRLSQDPDSPAYQRSQLSVLISLFTKTDAEPIKMEISRLMTAICRVYCSLADVDAARHIFFKRHPDLGLPLSFMISQKKWPAIRSEAWFVFALMARTPDGAKCISDMMHEMTVFQPLVELLTGKSFVDGQTIERELGRQVPSAPALPPAAVGTENEAEMRRVDRENALVMVSELLRNCGPDMASMRRSAFEDLLQGGSAIHVDAAKTIL